MDVRFSKSGGSDTNEFGLCLKLRNSLAARISHSRPQAPNELGDHLADRAFVGDPALYALGNVLGIVDGTFLRVPVARPFFHCANGAHPTVRFEAPALEENDLAGG